MQVFVAAGEADSVSATWMLRKVFQTDGVMHTIVPVSGYDQLQSSWQVRGLPPLSRRGTPNQPAPRGPNRRSRAPPPWTDPPPEELTALLQPPPDAPQEMLGQDGDDEFRTVVLVNCGATEDIRGLLELKPEARAYVVDAHRPVHLNNLSDENQQVFVLWDEEGEGQMAEDIPVDVAELFSDSDDDSDDGDSDDGEGDEDSDEGASGSGDEVVGGSAGAEEDPLGLHGDGSEGGDGGASVRGGGGGGGEVGSEGAGERRDQSQQEAGVSGQEDGEAEGRPSKRARTGQLSKAQRRQLRRRERDERAIRRLEYYTRGQYYGRSASELCYRLAQELNKTDNQFLWLAVLGLTDQLVHGHVAPEQYAASYEELLALVRQAGNYDQQTTVTHDDGTVTKAFVRGRIVEEEALRFHVYRHWSLYEAMLYSPFVATRLRTWSEGGKAHVEQLLAKMGLPLKEAVKPYASMDPEVRADIPRKVDEWVALFSLADVKFDSFKLHFGYRDNMGAADMVSAVTALLEAGADGQEQFWVAMDCLSMLNVAEIRRGLELSKEIQRAIVEHAGRAIQARRVERYQHFCCLNLSEGLPGRARELLCQPLALTRLASFVQDAHAIHASHRAFLRMVVVGPEDRATGKCCIVGVTSQVVQRQSKQGNALSFYFQSALGKIETAASNDAFMGSTVKIPAADVARFLDELHDVVLLSSEEEESPVRGGGNAGAGAAPVEALEGAGAVEVN